MHKLCIVLIKAEDRDDAISNVENFLEDYGEGEIWDWYKIGGRWNNILAPIDKMKEFDEKVKNKYPFLNQVSYAIKDIENKEVQSDIQYMWEEMELKGKNLYYDYYAHNIDTETVEDGFYNAIPLKDCIESVKEHLKNLDELSEEHYNNMIKEKEKEKIEGVGTMSAYYANRYAECKYGDFSFELNVYNATENVAEQIPMDITEYYAVVVDMHN